MWLCFILALPFFSFFLVHLLKHTRLSLAILNSCVTLDFSLFVLVRWWWCARIIFWIVGGFFFFFLSLVFCFFFVYVIFFSFFLISKILDTYFLKTSENFAKDKGNNFQIPISFSFSLHSSFSFIMLNSLFLTKP